jgi:hypothetical protein
MASADLWLKPLDLRTLSDERFKKAYTVLAAEFKADPTSEAIKAWVSTYKRESLLRKIKKTHEKILNLEHSIYATDSFYLIDSLDADLGSELMYLSGLLEDLIEHGPETAEGAESPELQTKRLDLIAAEKKCIEVKLDLRWRDNTDEVNDYHHKRLAKYKARVTTLIAEIKAML